MKRQGIALVVVALVLGIVVGAFWCHFFWPHTGTGGSQDVKACVNSLGQSVEAPGTNACANLILGNSCSGAFGEGTCRDIP